MPLGEERVGDAHGRIEQAARVAAQIEHQAEQLVALGGCGQVTRRLLEIRRRAFRERRQTQVGETVAQVFAVHRLDADLAAGQREMQRRLAAGAHHVERDLGAGRAAHTRHGGFDVFGIDGNVVDGDDVVARQNSGAVGGSAFERRHDGDLAAVEVHVEAYARVVARRADTDVLVLFGVQEGRVLVEIRHDAADRGLDDSLVVDAIDVFAPNAVDDFGDERRGFDRWIERGRRGFGSPRERCPDCAAECQPEAEHDAGEQHDYAAESQGHLLLLASP